MGMPGSCGGVGSRVRRGIRWRFSRRQVRGWTGVVLSAVAGGTLLCLPASAAVPVGGAVPSRVIVMASAGSEPAAERATVALGGRVLRRLGVIDGFLASVPSAAIPELSSLPGVRSVSPDRSMHPMSIVPGLGYDPADTGSLSAVTRIVNGQAAWAKGYTGQGVDVAVIDTGVAKVAGLNATGKVIDGPDLSFDSPATTSQGVDGYGHGTHMASIIAGLDSTAKASASGCTTCLNSSGYSDTTKFVGVAPEARIVNVKVGAADGAADVSQVIAAIDWVTQHAKDPGMNIRVLNLSFGTESTQAYTIDPLAQAAEQAWKHGIVVVAAAGNDGRSTLSLADPAYDPYVLAVGAEDPLGTLATSDDVVPKFAQHGTSARPVDVVAPGTHLLGLRVPGSYIDSLNIGHVGTRFQRGSGTSEATAVVSGLAAVLAQKFPTANPDAIKALIKITATPLLQGNTGTVNGGTDNYSGKGIPNADKATAVTSIAASQAYTNSTGTGTLDGARGGVYVTSNGVALTGQKDIFGHTFDSAATATLQASSRSWTGGTWNGSRWTGDGWSGSRWTNATWTGTDWAGSRWTGSRWTGMTWDGSRWTGTGWNGSRWTGTGWTGSRWSSSTWS
jgi:serine protease AprX